MNPILAVRQRLPRGVAGNAQGDVLSLLSLCLTHFTELTRSLISCRSPKHIPHYVVLWPRVPHSHSVFLLFSMV